MTKKIERRIVLFAFSAALSLIVIVGSVVLVRHYEPTREEAYQEAQNEREAKATDILASERVAYYTKVLAAFTGALFAVGFLQIFFLIRADQTARLSADAAKDAANAASDNAITAANTLAASHRAWIKGELTAIDPITVNAKELRFNVSLRLDNIGNAPALKIQPSAWLATERSGVTLVKEFWEECEKRRVIHDGLSFGLFPKETYPAVVGLSGFNMSLVLSAAEMQSGLEFDPNRKVLRLYVCTCINYLFPSSPNTIHQTRSLFEIRQRAGFGVNIEEASITDISLGVAYAGAGRYAD